jgi:hypothetical protein
MKKARSKSARAHQRQQRLQEQLLKQIELGAAHCAELERQFGQYPPPTQETLLKLYRVIILQLTAEAQTKPEVLKLVVRLMRPVFDEARLEELRRKRALDERRFEEKRQKVRASGGGGLGSETLAEIERQLRLL